MGWRERAVARAEAGLPIGERRVATGWSLLFRGIALAGLIAAMLDGRPAAAAAPAADGKRVFEAHCAVCHATEPEYHKEGPSLAGVYGRRAGTAPFFPRYRGLKGTQVVWNEQTLDAWLADPRAFAGGRDTSMTYQLADANERAAVIAYLRTLR